MTWQEPEIGINWRERDICPACMGTGVIEYENYDNYGQPTMTTSEFKCPRCIVNVGKYVQPLEEMLKLGKSVYIEAEPDNG